jgi:AraC-like DNA-binding protein
MYTELPPPASAQGALACVWLRVPGGGDSRPVLPDACVDIVWTAGRGAVLAGPDTGPAPAGADADAVIAGVRFAPGAGGPALRLPLDAVRDQRVALAELWPDLDRELPPDLTPDAALGRLATIGARLAAAGPPDAAIAEAARRLAGPATRVDGLAAHLGLSERQLRRRCHAAVGYGPKTLQRVLRFRRFLARADRAGADADLAWLAADAGYADQAHLTRECTRLAGLPPAALLRTRLPGAAAA